MIIGMGVDIVHIHRIEKLLNNFEKRFKSRCFSTSEQADCDISQSRSASYAKRFASKEAFSKALGTGISEGISWRDIVVANLPIGKPYISVSGCAAEKLFLLIPKGCEPVIHLTISDDRSLAQAFVIIESRAKLV